MAIDAADAEALYAVAQVNVHWTEALVKKFVAQKNYCWLCNTNHCETLLFVGVLVVGEVVLAAEVLGCYFEVRVWSLDSRTVRPVKVWWWNWLHLSHQSRNHWHLRLSHVPGIMTYIRITYRGCYLNSLFTVTLKGMKSVLSRL